MRLPISPRPRIVVSPPGFEPGKQWTGGRAALALWSWSIVARPAGKQGQIRCASEGVCDCRVTRDLNPRPSVPNTDAQPTELVSLVDSFPLRIQWTGQDSNLYVLVSFYLEAPTEPSGEAGCCLKAPNAFACSNSATGPYLLFVGREGFEPSIAC